MTRDATHAAPHNSPPRTAGWLSAALLVLAVLALEYSPLLTRDGTFPGHDWSDIHQVDAQHVERALDEGGLLPWWAPDLQGGTALFAVPTKPFTYPPFLAAVAAWGPYLGMNLATLAHVALAAVGMLLLMRRLGAGPLGAAVSAALFVAATYPGSLFKAQPFWGYSLAWWPFTLLALLAVLRSARPRRAGVALGLLLALQLLAGGVFQLYWLAVFGAPFALVFLLEREARARLGERLLGLALAVVIAGGLAAVKLLPALAWVATSGRAGGLTHDEIFFTYGDMEPFDQGHPALTVLYVMVAVGQRIGVISMGVGLLLGLALAARRRVTWAALLGTAACLLVVSGLVHDQLYAWLPGYDRMRMPYRFFYPAGLGALMLTGLGVDGLARWAARRGALASAALALLVSAGLLLDLRLVPGVSYHAFASSSIGERQAMARPVLEPVLAAPGLRLQYPRAKDQPLWLDLHLRGTSGVIGGGGSENARYLSWLPHLDGALQLEYASARVLDVLATGWIGSWEPLDLPWLTTVYAPDPQRPPRVPTNAFVARLSPDARTIEWCGYLGGYDQDGGYALAVDGAGRVTVTGRSTPSDGDRLPRASGADAFVATLDPDGALRSRHLLGGAGYDWGLDVALTPDGRPVVVGRTTSARVGSPPDASATDAGWDALLALGPPAITTDTRDTAAGTTRTAALYPAADATRTDARDAAADAAWTGFARDPAFVPVPGEPGAFLAAFRDRLVRADRDGVTVLLSVPRGEATAEERHWWALRLALSGRAPDAPPPAPGAALAARTHWLTGPLASHAPRLAHHDRLRWTDAWPGVDLELRAGPAGLEWHLLPRSDEALGAVAFEVSGVGEHGVDAQGRLHLRTPAGELLVGAPSGGASARWQVTADPRDAQRVVARWKFEQAALSNDDAGVGLGTSDAASTTAGVGDGTSDAASTTAGVGVGVGVGTSGAASTTTGFTTSMDGGLLGGACSDFAKSVAVGPDGDVYVAGFTLSGWTGAPAPPPGSVLDAELADPDAFLARIDGHTGELRSFTVLGGEQGDWVQGLAVDGAGRALLIGSTRSDERSFPVVLGPSLHFGGVEDAWVARLSPDGAALEFCGFLGGAAGDYGQGIAVAADGSIAVCGDTKSDEHSLPVRVGPDLTFNGAADAFVGRLRSDGSAIDFLGYIGGSAVDVGYDLAIDPDGRLVVAGSTASSDGSFPARLGPALTHGGGQWDAFVTRVAPDGSYLVSSGFLGGAAVDECRGLALDAAGRVHLVGTTRSREDSFPATGGPALRLGGDAYTDYLARERRKHGGKPYARPFLYRRTSCREPVCLIDRPVLVAGDPDAREAALRVVLGARWFEPRATSYVQDPSVDVDALDAASARAWRSVLFAVAAAPAAGDDAAGDALTPGSAGQANGAAAARAEDDAFAEARARAQALVERLGGRVREVERLGVFWDPDDARLGAPPPRLDPLPSARVTRTLDTLEVDLSGTDAGFLLLSEVFTLHPGWEARVDGEPAPLLVADGLVTAVRLPPGAQRASFRFRPPRLMAGAAISGLTALALLGGWLTARRRRGSDRLTSAARTSRAQPSLAPTADPRRVDPRRADPPSASPPPADPPARGATTSVDDPRAGRASP